MRLFFYIITYAFSLSLIASCEKKEQSLLEKSWDLFEEQNYIEAYDGFVSLIDKDSVNALVGAGWCKLRLGQHNQAIYYFNNAQSNINSLSGIVFAAWSNGQLELSISTANEVLVSRPFYAFKYDKRITYTDLIWVQAASYYELGDYAACLQKITLLDNSYNASLNDPEISSLLLAKLQSLSNIK